MLSLFAQAAAVPAPVDEVPIWKSGALGYMFAGGVFMWPILILAVVGVGVVIDRFRSLRLIGGDGRELRANVLQLLQQDRVEDAIALCNQSRGPIPAVLAVGIHRYEVLRRLNVEPARIEEQVVKAMDDYGPHVAAALERNMWVLAMVATVAPMVGSLGTVVGMVAMFDGIVNTYGTKDIILAAAEGIKIKLIVTVWGLMVGIPAYMFHNYFSATVNDYILEAEETASKLIEALTLRHATGSARVDGPARAPVRVGGGV